MKTNNLNLSHSDCIEFFNKIVQKAESLYELSFSEIKLVFDPKPLRKNVLAFYRPSTKTVHLNDVLLSTLNEITIKQTIIHEIAHHLTPILFPNHKQAHGPEFKRIDKSLGGLGRAKAPVDDFDAFEVASSTRKITTFEYICLCQTFKITKNRHTRILNGAKYHCGKCKAYLKFNNV